MTTTPLPPDENPPPPVVDGRARSPWDLFEFPIMFAAWGGLTIVLVAGLNYFHQALYLQDVVDHRQAPLFQAGGAGPGLLVLGALFASLAPSMMIANAFVEYAGPGLGAVLNLVGWLVPGTSLATFLANLVLRLTPKAREEMEKAGENYAALQGPLVRKGCLISLFPLALAILGACLQWPAKGT